MGLKKKFGLLAAVAGLFMAVISIIGFYNAYTNLEESVEAEFITEVDAGAHDIDGWVASKADVAVHGASALSQIGDLGNFPQLQTSLGLAAYDSQVAFVYFGDENGRFIDYKDGDLTSEIDPRTRDWYKNAKALQPGQVTYSDAYKDEITKKLVVTASSPVYSNGAVVGAVGADVALDVLDEKIQDVDYRGEGLPFIVEKSGIVLATKDESLEGKNLRDVEGINKHYDDMLKKDQGLFFMDTPAGETIVAYTIMPSTGWILGLAVPTSVVFASVNTMKITYIMLTLVGMVLMVLICFKFSSNIVKSVLDLEEHAEQMAKGNLHLEDIEKVSEDEIGNLCVSFNAMRNNLRQLITRMASTAEQVAASSEELTANANQSAESAIHVAETVNEVSGHMNDQLNAVNTSKSEVDAVFNDITIMADKSKSVSRASSDTAEAAKRGAKLMEEAVTSMGNIEKSVMTSAEMVKQLGENSQEIGTIVEAISAISDQTNLLALNAAIEAARAGEAGRGFAVVAEEVRKLAAESQTSAEQIKERIFSIQNNTQRTVEAMEKGTNEVVQGTKAIRDVGAQFQTILGMVDDIQVQMQDINNSVQTVSSGATNIVGAVDEIDSISAKTADNTRVISGETQQQSASNEEIAAASNSLAHLAMEMQEAIGKFRV